MAATKFKVRCPDCGLETEETVDSIQPDGRPAIGTCRCGTRLKIDWPRQTGSVNTRD